MEILIVFITLIVGSELISIHKLGVLKCRKSKKKIDPSDEFLYYPTSCFFLNDSPQNQTLNSSIPQQTARVSQNTSEDSNYPKEPAIISSEQNSGDDAPFTELLFKSPPNNMPSNPDINKKTKANEKFVQNLNKSQISSKFLPKTSNLSNTFEDSIQQVDEKIKASKRFPTNLTDSKEMLNVNNATLTTNKTDTKGWANLVQNNYTTEKVSNSSNKIIPTPKENMSSALENASMFVTSLPNINKFWTSTITMDNQNSIGVTTWSPINFLKLQPTENFGSKQFLAIVPTTDPHINLSTPMPKNSIAIINDKCNEDIVKNLNGVYYSKFGYLKFEFTQRMNYSMACRYCTTHCMKLASISTEMLKDYLLMKKQMLYQLSEDIRLWISNPQQSVDCTNQNSSCPTVYLTEKPSFTDQFCNAENYFVCQYQKEIPTIFSCKEANSSTRRPFGVGLHKVSFGYVLLSSDYVNHWEAESVCRDKYCMGVYNVNIKDSEEIIPLMKGYGDSEFWINGQSSCVIREDCICQYIITTNKTIQQSKTLCHTKRPFICEYRINNS